MLPSYLQNLDLERFGNITETFHYDSITREMSSLKAFPGSQAYLPLMKYPPLYFSASHVIVMIYLHASLP